MAPERTTQKKAMEVEVEKLWAASRKSNMAGITRGYKALKDQLYMYLVGLETNKDGEKVSSDPLRTWHKAAVELTKKIMDKVSPNMRTVTEEKDDPLAPPKRAMEEVANLSEAVAKLEDKPDEERLRFLGRGLSGAKGNLMSLAQALMLSQDPSLAAEAHELIEEAEEAVGGGGRIYSRREKFRRLQPKMTSFHISTTILKNVIESSGFFLNIQLYVDLKLGALKMD
jgi:hypothetical protein